MWPPASQPRTCLLTAALPEQHLRHADTLEQVIDWVKDPVPADKYADQRRAQGCDPPNDLWSPSGHYCQGIQCVNGEP